MVIILIIVGITPRPATLSITLVRSIRGQAEEGVLAEEQHTHNGVTVQGTHGVVVGRRRGMRGSGRSRGRSRSSSGTHLLTTT